MLVRREFEVYKDPKKVLIVVQGIKQLAYLCQKID